MDVSNLHTQQVNDVGNLCQDPGTKGFDLQAGQSWIYPTNYSVRDYQFNIIQEALHKNTLVSLPTGLGKTFIAAVVMYNFYRWYPHDKIIFMAPTRPLVKQQMDACYNITAIPQEVTAELTGTKIQQSRTEIWQNKRVFFITPQVLQNDLAIIIELGPKIKCLVFDEAHRAKGNHAYCEVIRNLLSTNKLFRVLALSATPGNSSRDVIDVMQNLLIAHVEFRSEESPDVKPYVFERALETVVVPLGEKLQQIKDQYVQILEKYTRTLVKYKVIYGNCGNLTKGKIFMVMKEFQARNAGSRMANYAEIMKSLNICVTLYHAYETLVRCGLRAFLNFYEEHINNPLLSGNISLRHIMDDLRAYLGPNAEVRRLPDGTFTEVPALTKFGHPKFYKLRDILLAHFTNSEPSTRVIVFFEYRESASEAYALLSQSYPMIKARVFVGQGSGVTQKDQINTIKAFREGNCNTLLSTCIGEEGLDVGDVDLIVCFDIANKSPIRMIQRMGRTGRKKEGRVVVLVTEGKEQQTLKDCLIYKNNLGNFVSNSGQLEAGKYADNPKMIPSYIQPKCQKMFITVKQPVVQKSNNLKDMLKKISSAGPKFSDDLEIIEIKERIKSKVESFWDKEFPLQCDFEQPKINFHKHIEKQRSYQTGGSIKHSKQTEIFVSLLQFADSKRFNLPLTQQISKLGDFSQNKILKQGDIRSMFARPQPISLSQETYVPNTQQHTYDKEKDITQSFPSELFDEIDAYLSIQSSTKQTCKTCELLFECPKIDCQTTEQINLSGWVQPDLSILDSITARDLEIFADSLTPKSKEIHQDFLEGDSEIFDNITFSEAHATLEKTAYETPRNFDHILKSFRIDEDADEAPETIVEKPFAYETPKSFNKVLSILKDSLLEEFETGDFTTNDQTQRRNFDAISKHSEEPKSKKNLMSSYGDVLAFFKLSSLDDIFETRDLDETIVYTPELSGHVSPKKQSPDLFETSPDLFPSSDEKCGTPIVESDPGSPILCSYDRLQQLKAKKKLFDQSRNEEVGMKPKLSNLMIKRKSFYESTRNKSGGRDSKDEAVELDVSDICDLSSLISDDGRKDDEKNTNETEASGKKDDDGKDRKKLASLDVTDLCDFGSLISSSSTQNFDNNRKDSKQTWMEEKKRDNYSFKSPNTLDITDICDFSSFLGSKNSMISHRKKQHEAETSNKEGTGSRHEFYVDTSQNSTKSDESKPSRTQEKDDLDINDLCDLSIFGLSDSNKTAKVEKNNEDVEKNLLNTKTGTKAATKNTNTQKRQRKEDKEFLKKDRTKELTMANLCDVADFFGGHFEQNEKEKVSKPKNCDNRLSNLDDFGDISVFSDSPPKELRNKINNVKLNDNPTKQPVTPTSSRRSSSNQKIEENTKTSAKSSIIDLTDSDLEVSPVKAKQTQVGNKTTQISITQILSLIAKSDEPKSGSQKENVFTPNSQKPKPGRSLSAKKGVVSLKPNGDSPRTSQKKTDTAPKRNQTNSTPKANKKKWNISLAGDSDDEFEDTVSFKSPVFAKPKPIQRSEAKKSNTDQPTCSKQLTKRKKLLSEFIEHEAEVSEDERVAVSDDEDSGEDCFEASFIADKTVDSLNTTNMHAKYLESVKSPRRGVFKIPQKFKHNISNVYSQEVNNADNTYLNDSFCVGDADGVSSERHDLSELDILERKLKEMKKKKRKKSEEATSGKRRRIIVLSDDSD